jgi:tetrahydromethanopterin S-methyltransferase subunit G
MRVALPQMPQSVQQTLGPEATGDFSQWFEIVLVEHAVRRDEYREVLSRLDILEHDVADVKTSITDLHRTMDDRFDRVNERFDRMNSEMNERFDRTNSEMNKRFDEMYRHISTMTRWTVGTLALIGTIMTILMAIAQFT